MILHLDGFSGISGDMALGALIDLGVPLSYLKQQLALLSLGGYRLCQKSKVVQGITAVDFSVELDPHALEQRTYRDIREVIEGSELAERVQERALTIFERLAQAEGKIHGVAPDEVHFHEVGAVDSIVDIVGVALGLEFLGVDEVISAPLPVGRGFVQCQHGRLPLPAPATLELLRGVPLYGVDLDVELITPTGAALVAVLVERFLSFPEMTVEAVGYGAGDRQLPDRPNLLRLVLGRHSTGRDEPSLIQIEANIDDLSPEVMAYVLERLLECGVRDAWLSPIQMKKGRAATLLGVLCQRDALGRVGELLFEETSTFGFRYFPVERQILQREWQDVETRYGTVPVKIGRQGEKIYSLAPEYEACRHLARQEGRPLKEIYAAALSALPMRPKDDQTS
jgi:pyridinium-3,5-bisthiocarboxylic acid mononucleotide nickel chelatase